VSFDKTDDHVAKMSSLAISDRLIFVYDFG